MNQTYLLYAKEYEDYGVVEVFMFDRGDTVTFYARSKDYEIGEMSLGFIRNVGRNFIFAHSCKMALGTFMASDAYKEIRKRIFPL